MNRQQVNLKSVAAVARGLQELRECVAFVGGATVALYIDDIAAEQVRVTTDVDFVVEVTNLGDYSAFETRLRELGFSNATESDAPICRWRFDRYVVDAMPTDEKILGFSNRWYANAMANLSSVEIEPGLTIYVFKLPYFLASKFEAFKGRGHQDWRISHDIEDVVAVLDGATEVATILESTSGELGGYLRDKLRELLNNPDIDEILEGHMGGGPTATTRATRLKNLLQEFVNA